MIGDIDKITPLITMFFLSCYAMVNACTFYMEIHVFRPGSVSCPAWELDSSFPRILSGFSRIPFTWKLFSNLVALFLLPIF